MGWLGASAGDTSGSSGPPVTAEGRQHVQHGVQRRQRAAAGREMEAAEAEAEKQQRSSSSEAAAAAARRERRRERERARGAEEAEERGREREQDLHPGDWRTPVRGLGHGGLASDGGTSGHWGGASGSHHRVARPLGRSLERGHWVARVIPQPSGRRLPALRAPRRSRRRPVPCATAAQRWKWKLVGGVDLSAGYIRARTTPQLGSSKSLLAGGPSLPSAVRAARDPREAPEPRWPRSNRSSSGNRKAEVARSTRGAVCKHLL